MRPITVTVGPLASAVVNNIAASQSPGAAGTLTLSGTLVTGGVATLDTPRRILITTASTISFTITGTDWSGSPISETVTNAGASVASVLSYATVTKITNAAAGTAITVGTNTVADSPWVFFDAYGLGPTTVQANVTGTANYTLWTSNDDPNSPTNPVNPNAINWSTALSTMVATAVSGQGFIEAPFLWAKVTLNSETAATSYVTTTFVQFANSPL